MHPLHRATRRVAWQRIPLACLIAMQSACALVPEGERPSLATLAGKPDARPRSAAAAQEASILPPGTLAILTPTAGWGQEENRQALALEFSEIMTSLRPELHTMPLAGTLSAINAAGLAETYDRMYVAYRNTGLFQRDELKAIGQALGARYLLQIKLGAFDQSSRSRFTTYGVNLVQSQGVNVRLLVQVWDASDGRIVWERSHEALTQSLSLRERAIPMAKAVRAAAEALVKELPQQRA